jgi:hypothetical protein
MILFIYEVKKRMEEKDLRPTAAAQLFTLRTDRK